MNSKRYHSTNIYFNYYNNNSMAAFQANAFINRILHLFIVFCVLFLSFSFCQRYPDHHQRGYDEYDRNGRQQRVHSYTKPYSHEVSYFKLNETSIDNTQRQVPVVNPNNLDGRTPRYEWGRHYTTTIRPDSYRRYYESSSSSHSYSDRENNKWPTDDYHQRPVNPSGTLNRGSSSDPAGRHMPGPYVWYNETYHWSESRPRGYDPDLDGTTLPPPDREITYDEEDWDGSDLKIYHIDDRHPAIYPAGSMRCDDFQACYPATGNLLIGREDRLKASSTCGLRQPVRYCVVSHLKEKKKCFYCDSRDRFKGTARYHGIENVVSRVGQKRKQFWWQAENGVENVYIQFDLEAEFHFTHLVITFKTFRPAAMLIERSHDFGRTWKVYQYFAHDCGLSFPGIPIGPRNRITDTVCDSRYSGVDPSTEGEVIFRVLPPNIHIEDPYAKEVQDMLKITNLRINFTNLHTLGDNLLDPRGEVKEKYYYAVYDMVVRGSCSCYGHASRCIPSNHETIPDMVYGRCECTHHTKGLNCELCEDLYNDLEWKPAIGRQTNACKKCDCNNHASKCHFDMAVYQASGNKSGGVCDDCQHNTMGVHCELCRHSFYRIPNRRLDDPYVCQQCDCDPRGSKDDGSCDQITDPDLGLEAGKCSCKINVEGQRCDHCKPGFWNLHEINPDGCEPCSCNQLGTVGNQGCNVNTGECICKRNVVGRDCNQCAPNYYGLGSYEEGCKACDCDPGGSLSPDCDLETGQCNCRPYVTGRRCDMPEPGYFVPLLDHLTYEAENAKPTQGSPIVTPRNFDERMFWTGTGFNRLPPNTGIEFNVNDVPTSKYYDVAVRYEPEASGPFDNAQLNVKRPYATDSYGPCANYSTSNDMRTFRMSPGERVAIIDSICLEKGIPYQIELNTGPFGRPTYSGESPSVLVDSIALIPKANDIPFLTGSPEQQRRLYDFEHRCVMPYYHKMRSTDTDEYCKKTLMSTGFYNFDGAQACNCDPTGSTSTECDPLGGLCSCKPFTAPRTCDRCHVGYYGFGPDGCKACHCHPIGALNMECHPTSGQCNCRPETYGRQCDECQPGYWNYPNCQRCECNGLSDQCDSKTGICINCRDNTAGMNCNECAPGYYGDPLGRMTGKVVPCRPCPCPGVGDSGMSHAKTCQLDPRTGNVLCHCMTGYTGERCERCDENYYGEPNLPGGECIACNCSGNVDISQPGNCDPKTGECLKCLYNTGGPNCEVCKPGYYGNALEHSCAECICHHLGTDPRSAFCNQTTGQCSCLPNVEGLTCNRCADNHWNLASQKGCEPCDCDLQGSHSMKCNEIDGKCHCKSTFGGRACDECLPNHYGNPKLQCNKCECNMLGSQSHQCDKITGECVCIDGISGAKCDRCARGFTGMVPRCEACGECFDSWNNITNALKQDTFYLLDKARQMKQTGTHGAYTKEFTQIEMNLDEINKILAGQNIDKFELERVQHMIEEAKSNLAQLQESLNNHERNLEDTKTNIINVDFKLELLATKSNELEQEANKLREQTFALQEANVEGAYNMTKDAQRRSRTSKNLVEDSSNILAESETKRRNTELLIDKSKGQHDITFNDNNQTLKGIQKEIAEMENGLPTINNLVCDGSSTLDVCDPLCGGAGCGRCGGLSCTKGATTKASKAVDLAKKAEQELQEKDRHVKDELRRIKEARDKSDEALAEAKAAFERIMMAKNQSTNTAVEVNDLLNQIDSFLRNDVAQAKEVRELAEKCQNMKISLDEDQIRNLALEINKTIAGLKDIDSILDKTRDSLAKAQNLKIKADNAKTKTNEILSLAEKVKELLNQAQDARRQAKASIDKADQTVNTINQNLQEIDRKAGEAKQNADEAKYKISELKDRLGNLTKKFTSNKFNIENAEREAYNATAYATEANKIVEELEGKYRRASQQLDQKSKVSDDLKKRARDLKDNASRLLNNVSVKLKSIEEFENDIDNNEQRLDDLRKKIEELDTHMKNHLEHIEKRSKYYRDCQA